MPVDFDIDVFLDQNRGNKPPYACPVEECGKVFKKWISIEHHMDVHREPVYDTDCFSPDGLEDSADGCASGGGTVGKKPRPGDDKGGRRRRRSMSPPSSGRIMKSHDSLSFADSQKFVTFDSGMRSQRFSIFQALTIIWENSISDAANGTDKNEVRVNGDDPKALPSCVDLAKQEVADSPKPSECGTLSKDDETPSKNKKTPSIRQNKKMNSNKKPSRPANRLATPSARNSFQAHGNLPKLPDVEYEVVNDDLLPRSHCASPLSPHRPSKRTSTDEVGDGYIVYIEPTTEELDEQVEYDIDEEDELWLEAKNCERKKGGLAGISDETFEYIVDRFEKESEFCTSNSPNATAFGINRKNISIDDDAVCAICLDGTCENTNAILFCDMCNLAVHQECYGVPYIPEGQWLCRRCLHSPSKPVECVLCPNKGGAFKKTVDDRWTHVTCALWIPEVIFANPVFLEPVDNIDNIPNARWRLNCYICRQRGIGACIQCHKNSCYAAFHVTCAQQAGLYMKIEGVRDRGEHGTTLNVKKTAFCDQHSPPDHIPGAMYAHSDEDSGPPSADRQAQMQKARMRQARKILAERRNSTPAVSMPIVQKARLKGLHDKLAKELNTDCHAFLEDLYRFWTLKRQQRNGVPLLRRLQAASNQHRQPGLMMVCDEEAKQLRAQMKFWQRLRQDLEKARLLSELIRKREKLKKELFRVHAMTLEIRLQPFVCFLKKLITKLQEFDKECFFAEPVDENEVPGYSSIIKKPMDFSTMRRKATNHDYTSLKALESDIKLMISNCMTFNPKDSVYYKAAVRLREKFGPLFHEASELVEALEFDLETGLHRCDVLLQVKDEKEDPEAKLENLEGLSPAEQLKALCAAFEARCSAGAAQEALLELAKRIEGLGKDHGLPDTSLSAALRQKISDLILDSEKPSNGVSNEAEASSSSEANMQPPVASRRRSRAARQSVTPSLDSPLETAPPPASRKRPPVSPESPALDGECRAARLHQSDLALVTELHHVWWTSAGPLKRRRLSSRSSTRASRAAAEEEEEEAGGMPHLEKAPDPPRRTSPRRQSSCATDSSTGQPSPLPSPTPWRTGPVSPRLRQRARSCRGSTGEEAEAKEAARGVRKSRRRRGGSDAPEEEVSLHPPALEPCSFAAAPGALASPSPLDPQLRQSVAFTAYRSCAEDELEDSNVSAPCSRRSPRGHGRLLRSVGSPMAEEDEESRRSEEEEEESSFASSLESVLKKSAATAAAAVAATTPSGSVSNSNPDSRGSESAGFGANGMPEEMEMDDEEEDEDEDDEELLLEGADSETDERATVSSAGDLHLEPLDLVWAKCRGYPWYPGLIIDPDMPRDGYTHNGVPIPVPPEAVLDSGRKARHRRPFLVLFFDQKRTWQWLNRDKLEPLGVDSSLDLYLMHQTRRSVQKKSVRKAYENAVEHLCKVNGRPYPFAEGSTELSPYHS